MLLVTKTVCGREIEQEFKTKGHARSFVEKIKRNQGYWHAEEFIPYHSIALLVLRSPDEPSDIERLQHTGDSERGDQPVLSRSNEAEQMELEEEGHFQSNEED